MYLALYRKYRPKKFADVIGQNHIIKTLQNQIALDKVGHAYLFCGSRGTGKTSTAKIFAREINCSCGGGGTCAFCQDNLSLDILEIDAASNNGVDEIRDLREKVKYPPVDGKYKVYIIDEVHMLSPSAFNALLKTLEEPPKHAVFILATTEVHKLPATILSRCMRFDFKLVSVEELSSLLKKVFESENVKFDEQSINLIARAGEGSVRDTLSIADRCVSFAGNNLTAATVVEVLGATWLECCVTDAYIERVGITQCVGNHVGDVGPSGVGIVAEVELLLTAELVAEVHDGRGVDDGAAKQCVDSAFPVIDFADLWLHVCSDGQAIFGAVHADLQTEVVVLSYVACVADLLQIRYCMLGVVEITVVASVHAQRVVVWVEDGADVAIVVAEAVSVVVGELQGGLICDGFAVAEAGVEVVVVVCAAVVLHFMVDGVAAVECLYEVIVCL